jgi:hypothetical protein
MSPTSQVVVKSCCGAESWRIIRSHGGSSRIIEDHQELFKIIKYCLKSLSLIEDLGELLTIIGSSRIIEESPRIIKDHQRSSGIIKDHQRSSGMIKDHQGYSRIIKEILVFVHNSPLC